MLHYYSTIQLFTLHYLYYFCAYIRPVFISFCGQFSPYRFFENTPLTLKLCGLTITVSLDLLEV